MNCIKESQSLQHMNFIHNIYQMYDFPVKISKMMAGHSTWHEMLLSCIQKQQLQPMTKAYGWNFNVCMKIKLCSNPVELYVK